MVRFDILINSTITESFYRTESACHTYWCVLRSPRIMQDKRVRRTQSYKSFLSQVSNAPKRVDAHLWRHNKWYAIADIHDHILTIKYSI